MIRQLKPRLNKLSSAQRETKKGYSTRTRSQALPGNADPEALPPIETSRGRASGNRFPGRA
jgi:hypothetical protein